MKSGYPVEKKIAFLSAPAARFLFFLLLAGFFANNISAGNCDSIPPLNRSILAFVNTSLNTKVGRGQCWDLAAEALHSVNATWDGLYRFGREVNMKTECVFPGDIIQFEKVRVEYEKNGMQLYENMSHHTAIIYKVNSTGNFDLAHQNIGYKGKKVSITNLDIKNIKRGKFTIFRPTQ